MPLASGEKELGPGVLEELAAKGFSGVIMKHE